jgi:hypothetical protein
MADVIEMGRVRAHDMKFQWTVPANIVNAKDYAVSFRWEGQPQSTYRYTSVLAIQGGTGERSSFMPAPVPGNANAANGSTATSTSATVAPTTTSSVAPTTAPSQAPYVLNTNKNSATSYAGAATGVGCAIVMLVAVLGF